MEEENIRILQADNALILVNLIVYIQYLLKQGIV